MNEARGRLTREGIRIYDASDYDGMHKAGRLAAQLLDEVAEHVFPGQTTGAIDDFIRNRIEEEKDDVLPSGTDQNESKVTGN